MEDFSTTPITITVIMTTPLSYLSMPKVNINATGNNCLTWKKVDTPRTEKKLL